MLVKTLLPAALGLVTVASANTQVVERSTELDAHQIEARTLGLLCGLLGGIFKRDIEERTLGQCKQKTYTKKVVGKPESHGKKGHGGWKRDEAELSERSVTTVVLNHHTERTLDILCGLLGNHYPRDLEERTFFNCQHSKHYAPVVYDNKKKGDKKKSHYRRLAEREQGELVERSSVTEISSDVHHNEARTLGLLCKLLPSLCYTPVVAPAKPPLSWQCNGKGKDGYKVDYYGNGPPSGYPSDWLFFGSNWGWHPSSSWGLPSGSWTPPSAWAPKKATWWGPSIKWTLKNNYGCPSFWPKKFIFGSFIWI
ncbi:hypothetical protein T439DRAFT_358416 [Meredithblackwellia eburnea MCA 4105]